MFLAKLQKQVSFLTRKKPEEHQLRTSVLFITNRRFDLEERRDEAEVLLLWACCSILGAQSRRRDSVLLTCPLLFVCCHCFLLTMARSGERNAAWNNPAGAPWCPPSIPMMHRPSFYHFFGYCATVPPRGQPPTRARSLAPPPRTAGVKRL